MSQQSDIALAVERLVGAILESARADSTANIKLAKVVGYSGPGPRVGADGKSVTWTGAVDVDIVPWSTRVVENMAQKTDTETLVQNVAGGVLVAGPEARVEGVPVLFVGGMEMCITEPPPVGSYGLLFLTGKHHGLTMSTGQADVPRLPPTTERNSDAVFLGGFVVGATAALLPTEVQPAPGVAAQMGPRSAEGSVVFLRRIPGGWVLGGTDIRLGSPSATKPMSGVGDGVTLAPDIITWIAAVSLATGVAPPVDVTGNKINSGSPTVKGPT